jgi:hypothetical protein
VFVAVVLALPPTAAGTAQVTDPYDVPGPLDLELVRAVRIARGQPIMFRIRAQAPFKKTVLGPAANWVVFLNVDVDASVDYGGTITLTRTTSSVFFSGQGNNSALPMQRPSVRTMRFTAPDGASLAERSGLDDRAVAQHERGLVQHGMFGRGPEQLQLDRDLT